MASFVQDRDLEAFNESNDLTAAAPTGTSSSRPTSVSPQKKKRYVDATNTKENESLIMRMGGPSAAKAGLGKDQETINRIIYEASKGSKYFENERKRDEATTKKVQVMLTKMEERLAAVPEGSLDWKAIE